MLDSILSPRWEDRLYSFNSLWCDNEQMGSMRNGCGDEFYVLFNSHGCFVKGFDHESAMSSWGTDEQKPWPGLFEGLPSEFLEASKEPAFSMENISFCIWRLESSACWEQGKFEFVDCEDPDGSEYLLSIFDGNPMTYKKFAAEYYEVDVPLSAINKIYSHSPLTEELVRAINPELCLAELEDDLKEIGYPNR